MPRRITVVARTSRSGQVVRNRFAANAMSEPALHSVLHTTYRPDADRPSRHRHDCLSSAKEGRSCYCRRLMKTNNLISGRPRETVFLLVTHRYDLLAERSNLLHTAAECPTHRPSKRR